jgi:hypothetical protein
MSDFKNRFFALPSEDQSKVLDLLVEILRRRGNPGRLQHVAVSRKLTIESKLEEIASLFSKNGHEIEVLT